MGKIWVEVSILSARGLRRSSLWKLQWFAVGWIDPNNKYCTKIDASGNENPVWRTKFTHVVDSSKSNFHDLELHAEVYSREPVFLREKLQGTATIVLKEFLTKHQKSNFEAKEGNEDVCSFQLRRRNSNKPQGLIDVSIRISEEREALCLYPGQEDGPELMDHNNSSITLATGTGSVQAYPQGLPPQVSIRQRRNPPPTNHYPYAHPRPHPQNYSSPMVVGGPSYPSASNPSYPPPPPQTRPPPPPAPANAAYVPTFPPRIENPSTMYMNMESTGRPAGGPGHVGSGRVGPGLAVGMGAGALAAGAAIFGDDFMSSFDIPSGLQDANLTISVDPPF